MGVDPVQHAAVVRARHRHQSFPRCWQRGLPCRFGIEDTNLVGGLVQQRLLGKEAVRLPDPALYDTGVPLWSLKPRQVSGVRDRGAESMATARSATARNLHVAGEPTPTWGVRIR